MALVAASGNRRMLSHCHNERLLTPAFETNVRPFSVLSTPLRRYSYRAQVSCERERREAAAAGGGVRESERECVRNGNARLRVSGLVYWRVAYLREITIWTSTPAASRGRLALGSSLESLEEGAGEPGRCSCMSNQRALGQHAGRSTALMSLSTVNRSLRVHRATLLHLRGVCVRVCACVRVSECV
jgi:hypothetical protein